MLQRQLTMKHGKVINYVAKYFFALFLQNRDTPLHLASKGGHLELAEILIKSGADTAAVNKVCYL